MDYMGYDLIQSIDLTLDLFKQRIYNIVNAVASSGIIYLAQRFICPHSSGGRAHPW